MSKEAETRRPLAEKSQSSFSRLAATLLAPKETASESEAGYTNESQNKDISRKDDNFKNTGSSSHSPDDDQNGFAAINDTAEGFSLFSLLTAGDRDQSTANVRTEPYQKFKQQLASKIGRNESRNVPKLMQLFNFTEDTLSALGIRDVERSVLEIIELLEHSEGESLEQNVMDLRVILGIKSLGAGILKSIYKVIFKLPALVNMNDIKECTEEWKQALKTHGNVSIAKSSADRIDFNSLACPPGTEQKEKCCLPSIKSDAEQKLLQSVKAAYNVDIKLAKLSSSNLGFLQNPEMIHWRNRIFEFNDTSNGLMEQQPSSSEMHSSIAMPKTATDMAEGTISSLCAAEVAQFIQSNFPDGQSLVTHILNLIRSHDSDLTIQGEIMDLLGVENIEWVERILTHRRILAEELNENFARQKKLRKHINQGAILSNNPIVGGNIVLQSKEQAECHKRLLKEEKKMKKQLSKVVSSMTEQEKLEFDLAQRMLLEQRQRELAEEQSLATDQVIPSFTPVIYKKKLPYVFDSFNTSPLSDFVLSGVKFALPQGTIRRNTNVYEELIVPPPPCDTPVLGNFNHVQIQNLDQIGQQCFKNFEKLNVIQSIVFEQAYNTLENLLICAPTGAGKTNIALLTVLKTIRDHKDQGGRIRKDEFKIIYLAPMKALAAEMTRNFSMHLAILGLKVKELTGDTQLTKKEIAETQMLVLTPEKWDVVTRKTDDEMLTQLVRLLIIDEVHLLHDERGPVIEAIVARAFRQMEVHHQKVRIVGLSATLPNYIDVAHFMRVNPERGLFFFDGRFRPVPLTQTFIGVHLGQNRSPDYQKQVTDEACYNKCLQFLRESHQVLVFVHSRSATSQLANVMKEKAAVSNSRSLFLPNNVGSGSYLSAMKSLKSARSRDIPQLFEYGMGIHHAGLTRPDRNLVERLFRDGHIRVMICTATLAWGVNLPAHAVIIRGTEIFDPQKGGFTDIGVLDVQQIFGRAGRPQYEDSGHGVIITTAAKVTKYVGMLIRQSPIESQFQTRILDHMNAEISRGTVSNLDEAVEWLRFTYFYIRARQNPLIYGINWQEVRKDPELKQFLTDLCYNSAKKLDQNKMIKFDSMNGYLSATDLGRIASTFYISYDTIEVFNDENGPVKLTQVLTDDAILSLITAANEFTQIKPRETEMEELQEMISFGCPLPMKGGGLATTQGKVNCLLQCHISRIFSQRFFDNFTLQAESLFVAQNASRIARALFEIVLRRGWAQTTSACLQMSKCINNRLWPFNSPLRQLIDHNFVKDSTVTKVEGRRCPFLDLRDMAAKDLGSMFSCDGAKLLEAFHMIPLMEAEAILKPITRAIIQVEAILTPAFTWNDKLLGSGAHRFWVFFENLDDNIILHYDQFILTKKKVIAREPQHIVFPVPVDETQIRHHYQLRIASDTFVVDDTKVSLSLRNCILPSALSAHTDLLDLEPLPITALKNKAFESLYSFKFFNPIQTQVFHALYEMDENTLIGAPTSSGKTLCAELAIFRLLRQNPTKKCAYIAPLKALVRERVLDWKDKFQQRLGIGIVEVSGDHTPSVAELNAASILITTPEKWDGITRCMETRGYVKNVELVIIDEIHLLGVERGAVLEAIVTRIKTAARKRSLAQSTAVRVIGLSTALANAGDVAEWIGVKEHSLYNFRPSVRPVPIEVHIQGFTGQHYCPRMALMNKPAFRAIKQFSPLKPTLLFVASRRQTRLTAMAFVSFLALEDDPQQWLHMDDQEMQRVVNSVKDDNLKMTLSFGIGMHHAGLQHYERSLVEKLFVERKIQVLIATSTLAWGINVPAHLVIVKGTEYYDGKSNKYVDFPVTDVLQMIGRAGRPQYDDSAEAVVFVQDVKKEFYKKFLYEPFPVESSLLPALPNHVNAEICAGSIGSRQQVVQYLAGTYLYRRLLANPTYYGVVDFSSEGLTKFIVTMVDNCVAELIESRCIIADQELGTLEASPLGKVGSKYYLDHLTIRHFSTRMQANLSVEQLLHILADCPEYREIPVRHNEDNINMELARSLPLKIPFSSDWSSPHVKTHLLYQAHFFRVHVPVDYLTDQRSILESCIRIIQAMFDLCVIFEWLDTAMNVMILLQQIIQARWYTDHPLLCLPHLSMHSIDGIGPLSTIPQLQQKFGIYNADNYPGNRKRWAVSEIKRYTILEESEACELLDALLRWPVLRLADVRLQVAMEECRVTTDPSTRFSIPLSPSTEYNLRLKLELRGPNSHNSKAYCPKFPKEKTSGWTIILGDRSNRRIVAYQKLTSIENGSKFVRLSFISPANAGNFCLTIYLMSDSYLGIDQEYDVFCSVI